MQIVKQHDASKENLNSHRARDKEIKDVTGDGMKERIGQDSIEAGRLQQRPHSQFCLPWVLCVSRLRSSGQSIWASGPFLKSSLARSESQKLHCNTDRPVR